MERPQPQLGTQTETLGKRVLAWIIDAIIIAVITFAVTSALGDGSDILGPFIGGAGILSFAYFIYFEAEYGQTLGKKVMNIVVVKEDGSDCDWMASVVRNVARIIDGFAFYLVGVIVIVLTDDNQRLGDIVADTVVVKVAPTTDETPEWSGLVIDDVREEGGDRYVVLRNASDETVDLSEASITDGADNRFRFAEGFALDSDETETFHVHESFAPDEDSTFTLTTRTGEEYEIR
jgi:uncharacterized RDD family membrane protein YckC